jgi:hypothetical protein
MCQLARAQRRVRRAQVNAEKILWLGGSLLETSAQTLHLLSSGRTVARERWSREGFF